VADASGATTYAFDAVGNLQNFTYPNGVTHAYSYDGLNRLTQVGAAKNAAPISNYAYGLGAAGNRLTVAELSGRTVNCGYDSLYRLTSEAVASDPHANNFTNGFTYDAVGNRKQWLVNGVVSNAYTFDPDDRLGSDQYDGNGNTVLSAGVADAYDFENHLIQKGAVTVVYDGDGNRVSETVGGVTTNYLVDTMNPTGYAQVVDELQNSTVTRTYSYGLERIDENQLISSAWTPSFYGYDGHGSVRQLTNSVGTVTDTYDYDAFGNVVNETGSTPNSYLFAGEAYDAALGLYYNRARYLNTTTGRFWNMDTDEGVSTSPLSLHKYLYASANPVNRVDPGGHQDVVEEVGAEAVDTELEASESDIEETAEKDVEEQLEPETLIHVTSGANAININLSGLSALQYPDVAPTIPPGLPGAFYAIGFKSTVPTSLVAEMASLVVNLFIQNRFGSAPLAAMVGSLPGPVFAALTASPTEGPIIKQSLNVSGPSSLDELVCLPESFPVIDEYNQGRWGIFPLIP